MSEQQLSPEMQQYIDETEREREKVKLDMATMQNNYGQLSMYQSNNPSNLAELQLDLAKEKGVIEHVLRGHVLKRDARGLEVWDETEDPIKRIFTDYGVDRIMNFINIYISLNIILSYYEPDEIKAKMKIIADELADVFYMEYEYLFYKPSIDMLLKRDKITEADINKMDNRKLEELYKKYKHETEKINAKNKKQYLMIHNMLVNAVHSAYNRALYGKERESLRKMMHISESNSGAKTDILNNQASSKVKWYNPQTW